MYRYYLSTPYHGEVQVTQEEFIRSERDAGFRPKPGCGPVATSSFYSGFISGRVECVDQQEIDSYIQ